MSSEPLSVRMVSAAETLEEASKVYDYLNPAEALWSAAHLRYEAAFVAQEEQAAADA